MNYVYCTTSRKKGSHLTYQDRQTLERMVIDNHRKPARERISSSKMAEMLGVHRSTISRELKRGEITQRDIMWKEYTSYSANVAQDTIDLNASAKGPPIKLGRDWAFHDFVEYRIIDKKHSPDAVIMKIENEGLSFKTKICTKTLYNYISKGYFLKLTNRNLPRRGKKPKRRYRRVRKSYRTRGKSIDQRPIEANTRSEFGHWEMDCVESGRGGRSCLLTLVGRQTNDSLNFKLLSQSQKQVKKQLDRMERKLGRPSFSRLFKSITVDNGSEFLGFKNLLSSLFSKKKARTEIYYCHLYSSYERGSNEQMNGPTRRFISKGSDISKVSKESVEEITNHLNTYPKRSLKGKTSEQLFHIELEKIGVAIYFFLPIGKKMDSIRLAMDCCIRNYNLHNPRTYTINLTNSA